MSQIALQSNASGTGTLTFAAPNTNTNRTLTLPDESGTLITEVSPIIRQKGVPAFSAYQSVAQTPAAATWTKVNLQTEEFDTTAAFDSITNYRFQPLVAGYYQFHGNLMTTATQSGVIAAVYKNGTEAKRGHQINVTGSFAGHVSCILYMNGTTDYAELYCYLYTSTATTAAPVVTYFQGILVAAA